jgi:hypothetical protein
LINLGFKKKEREIRDSGERREKLSPSPTLSLSVHLTQNEIELFLQI